MKRMETDKVIVIEKMGYRSEDIISCNGVARCIRNHGYKGGVVIVEDYDQNRREMKKQATGGKRLQRMLPKIDRGAMDRHIQPMRQRHSRDHQGEGEY